MNRENASIFLLSVAIIGFQLAIINLLSYGQWYHFAYLAVSVAMLGFGSSGVILAVWPKLGQQYASKLIPCLPVITGLLMLASPLLIGIPGIRFDTLLVFTSKFEAAKLLLTCFILFLPFLSGAMVLGLFFIIRSNSIPVLYAWNLAGSAVGGVLIIALSRYLSVANVASSFGLMAIVAGFFLAKSSKMKLAITMVGLAGCLLLFFQPKVPFKSEFKPLSKTLLIPDSRVIQTASTPQGTFEMVSSGSLRQASGLSLSYFGRVPLVDMAFLNAQDYAAFEKALADTAFYHQNLFSFPYRLFHSPEVLMLQPNSTFFTTQAGLLGSKEITIVEPLRPVADRLAEYPWFDERVSVVMAYPREYLINEQRQWHAIVFPSVGSFGGAGLSALKEEYLFTTESLVNAYHLLTPEGLLVFSTFMDNPPRNSLKLIALVTESARRMGLVPSDHMLSMRNWNTLLVILKRNRIEETERDMAFNFTLENGFDMVIPAPLEELNMMPDSTFQHLANQMICDDPSKGVVDYPFSLEPPTDNSPFFSKFLRMGKFRSYLSWMGADGIPFLELGYFIVWVSLAVCLLLALIAIAFPMLISVANHSFNAPVWFYFACLGLGFMLVEISLIQRTILVVGNPIMSSAVIISTMLCFSAVGSYLSSLMHMRKGMLFAILGIALLTSVLIPLGDRINLYIVGLPIYTRVVTLVLLIAPLALLMGMLFPLGMRYLDTFATNQIPVAWGVNGFFSVLAAPVATILAVEFGFSIAFASGAALYMACLPIVLLMYRKARGQPG